MRYAAKCQVPPMDSGHVLVFSSILGSASLPSTLEFHRQWGNLLWKSAPPSPDKCLGHPRPTLTKMLAPPLPLLLYKLVALYSTSTSTSFKFRRVEFQVEFRVTQISTRRIFLWQNLPADLQYYISWYVNSMKCSLDLTPALTPTLTLTHFIE